MSTTRIRSQRPRKRFSRTEFLNAEDASYSAKATINDILRRLAHIEQTLGIIGGSVGTEEEEETAAELDAMAAHESMKHRKAVSKASLKKATDSGMV